MDTNTFNGILRAVVPAILGYIAGKGLIPMDQLGALTTALVTLGSAIWSIFTNAPALNKSGS